MTNTTLGQRIAEGRKKLGLSQEAFGDRLGVSRQAASKWESDAAVPEIDKLITMSKIFGVSIGWLLGVEAPEAPKDTALSEEQLSAVTELLCRYPTPCPERKNRKWLMIACAAGLVVSLSIGITGLFLPDNAPKIDNTALQSQIDDLTGRNEALQQQIADMIQNQAEEYTKHTDILNQQAQKIEILEQLLQQKPPAEGTLPDQLHLSNELLDSWSLSPKLDGENDCAALRFSGFTDEQATEARLIAILGGYEMASAVCQATDVGWVGELELPQVDGYTYYFELTAADGTTRRCELTGHGLSDLSEITEPTLRFTTEGPVDMGTTNFWLPKPSILLEVGGPLTATCTWTDLQVVYYCNSAAADRKDLAKEAGGLPRSEQRLKFELYNIIFPLADWTSGSTHSLRLEGTVLVGGLEKSFSLPLGDWVMTTDRLIEAR